jgi:hypothetical protein
MATLLAMLIFAGFTPSFYARSWFIDYAPLALPVILHGLAGTVFVFVFAVQAWLIAAGSVAWHRRLGAVGAVLAAGLVASGIGVILNLERGHVDEPTPVFAAHVWANGAPLAAFALLVAAGVWQRGAAARHKRLMLMAAVVLLPPGTGRLFAMLDVVWLNFPVFVCAAFANAVYDVITRGRPHPLSLWCGAALVAMDLVTTRWLAAVGS